MPRQDPAFASRRATPPINWLGVPDRFYRKVSAVCRNPGDCEDLVRWFGDADFCPYLPIFLMIPGTEGVMLIGMGYATAAELRDDAVNIWGKYTARLAKTGSLMDFDALREKHGDMRKENVAAEMAEAFRERIRKHKANPITDPAREPQYVRVNEKTVFAQTQSTEWKDN